MRCRWSQNGGVSVFSQDCQEPNGIALSPREDLLYVSDTAGRCVRVYDAKGTQAGRVFARTSDSGGPDGVKTDAMGRVWVCEEEGVLVFAPTGQRLLTVRVPESPSNCAFSRTGAVLFITAKTSVYELDVGMLRLTPD